MTPSARPERRERQLVAAILAAILAIALALRLLKLGQANLWWDEALAVWAVRKGLVGVTTWTAGDVHPPLYFWCLWAWTKLFGESAFAMRSLSALLGTATVWAVYRLGRQIAGRPVGLLAAALTAVAPFAVWWSQELRMYMLAGLLCTAALRCALRWLDSEQDDERSPDLAALACSALAALGALYTVFLTGAALLALNLVVLLAWLKGGPRRQLGLALRWAAAQIGILALLAPWLIYSWGRMPTWSVATPVSPLFVARLYATLLATGVSENISRAAPAVGATLAVAALGFISLWRRRDRARRETWGAIALLLAVLTPGLVVYLSTLPRGLFYSPHVEARYFLPFAPAFWALLAWAAWELGRHQRWLTWALAGGLLALSAAYLPGHYRGRLLRDDLQSLVRTIISQSRPGDIVLLDSGSRYPVFLYDYERLAPGATRPTFATITRAEERLDAALVQTWIAANGAADSRIWLAEVDVQLTDPERLARAALAERLPLTASWGYGPNALLLFATDGLPPWPENASYHPEHGAAADLGGGRLRGWDLPVTRYAAGDTAHLALFWDAAPSEAVWLRLATCDGLTLLQRRLPNATGVARMAQDILVQEELPAGQLNITLIDEAAQTLSLSDIRVVGQGAAPLAAGEPVGATCGELTLEAYRVHPSGPISPGEAVVVDLVWRAQERPAGDYTLFVHALGAAFNPRTAGPLWGQHDAPPLAGQWPTSSWQSGDALLARHVVALDAATPGGDYQLEIGLYDSQSGARAPCVNAQGRPLGDQLLLQGFRVK
jgi:4-amino-4-deoxy-L-arabinose transferase-like glycosyltransferase